MERQSPMSAGVWRDRRVLVTGGTGFLGSHMTRALVAADARVTVVSRSGTGDLPLPGGVVSIRGDLRDPQVASACTRNQEVVLHFASKIASLAYNLRHPAEMMTYNTILDLQVMDAAARNGVSLFLYPSGTLVYDEAAATPITETASTGGGVLAACQGATWAKRAAEAAIRCYEAEQSMKFVLARLSNVYGPGDDFDPETAHLIASTIRRVAQGESPEIVGDGGALRAYLYVDDAVAAILRLLEVAPAGPVNIGGQHEVSVRDVVRLVVDVTGAAVVPRFGASGPVGLSRKLLDVTRLHTLVDFQETTPLREGLRQTYEWYRRHSGSAREAASPRGGT